MLYFFECVAIDDAVDLFYSFLGLLLLTFFQFCLPQHVHLPLCTEPIPRITQIVLLRHFLTTIWGRLKRVVVKFDAVDAEKLINWGDVAFVDEFGIDFVLKLLVLVINLEKDAVDGLQCFLFREVLHYFLRLPHEKFGILGQRSEPILMVQKERNLKD